MIGGWCGIAKCLGSLSIATQLANTPWINRTGDGAEAKNPAIFSFFPTWTHREEAKYLARLG